MKTIRFASIFLLFALIAGCAPINFYSDPALTKKTGLKFYPAKPLLQVEREPESGRIVKATIIYLPDMSNPQFMAVKNGLGASKADMKLSDGLLTSFGFESEQVLPESIEAFATLVSKSAGAVEDINSLKGLPGQKTSVNTVTLYEIIMKDGKTSFVEIAPDK